MEKNLAGISKTFPERGQPVTRSAFRKRLSDALRRRLFPNTGLSKQQLAHALTKAPETIDNWLAEYSQPDGYVLMLLIQFFDAAFANEIGEQHGVLVVKLSDVRRAKACRHLNTISPALPILEEMEGVA